MKHDLWLPAPEELRQFVAVAHVGQNELGHEGGRLAREGCGHIRCVSLRARGSELALEAKERILVAIEEDELGRTEGEQALDKRDADGAARAGDEDAPP